MFFSYPNQEIPQKEEKPEEMGDDKPCRPEEDKEAD